MLDQWRELVLQAETEEDTDELWLHLMTIGGLYPQVVYDALYAMIKVRQMVLTGHPMHSYQPPTPSHDSARWRGYF